LQGGEYQEGEETMTTSDEWAERMSGYIPDDAPRDVGEELLLAAKEAAIMLAEVAKAANVSPVGAGFNRLMQAIKDFERSRSH
jgi:hypothetical protein